jgi:glycosyltransferase involved in cell wall biosynthesis
VKIAFFQPPPAQRIGGLDAAIQNLRTALTSCAIDVTDTLDADTDLAHFHGLWQPAHARLARACTARRIPYVVSPHGMLEPWAWRHKWWKKWPYFHLVEKRYLAGATAILATAEPEAQRLVRFASGRPIETIPLGLTGSARPDYKAARRELGWAPEEIVLLYLSRLHVKKGPDLLLRALAGMRWPAVTRLVVVGDGDPRYVEQLRAYATANAGTLPRIDWAGAVWGEARWKYFQGADLFCLPTHSENFGLAVLESLQVGTPALTTIHTPWATQLSPDRGFIAEPKVPAIRTELARFFAAERQSPEARTAVSDWAWQQFAWPQLAPRYAAFYERVLETGASR